MLKDLIDESIDLALNYRQSGHPGGSRSKVHMLVALLFSGAMRWDLQRPWRPFMDRFVLSAGHTVPLIYATLSVLNEGLRARHERDGDDRFALVDDGRWAVTWEDLLKLRRRGGLPGHAEMEGKTLFLKFNTGPSGHGMPPSAGEALALKHAGTDEVKVFVFEGEGGLTPGASHETRNTAWGLGLNNLVFMVDWNDYGIDDFALSSVVNGTPETWFKPYGWRVNGTEQGSEWPTVTRAVLEAARGDNPGKVPSMAWFKTRKGRGYGKYDNKSHGTPWPMNAPEFWEVRKQFMAKYGVAYEGVDEPAPTDATERDAQARANFAVAMSVMRRDDELVTWLSDRLLEIAATVPDEIESFNIGGRGAEIFKDKRLFDYRNYPPDDLAQAGRQATQPRRAQLVGRVGQLVRQGGIRPTAVHRRLGGPRRLDQPVRLRQGLRRQARLGLVPARHEHRWDRPANGDHRVHQRRPGGGHGDGQHGRRPDDRFQRLLGHVLDLWLVLVPQIRADAPVQPACAGLRAEGRQSALDRRSRRTRDGRGLTHALRHLRDRRDAALP